MISFGHNTGETPGKSAETVHTLPQPRGLRRDTDARGREGRGWKAGTRKPARWVASRSTTRVAELSPRPLRQSCSRASLFWPRCDRVAVAPLSSAAVLAIPVAAAGMESALVSEKAARAGIFRQSCQHEFSATPLAEPAKACLCSGCQLAHELRLLQLTGFAMVAPCPAGLRCNQSHSSIEHRMLRSTMRFMTGLTLLFLASSLLLVGCEAPAGGTGSGGGSGGGSSSGSSTCLSCGGSGRCNTCNGTGRFLGTGDSSCSTCSGSGVCINCGGRGKW